LVNLVIFLAAAVFYFLCPAAGEATWHLSLINLVLCLFNLLPVYPLDGSRIARELLAEYWGFRFSNRHLKRFSYVISGVMAAAGLLLFKHSVQGFNLLVAGIYILSSIKNDFAGEASIMSIKDMLYRHTRLLKKGIYPVRDLAVLESMQLNSVIKCMDFDRFHIIYVLGKCLNIERICTEKEIMDYIARYGGDITFAQLGSGES
jgi:stage IV sporulation protein FB